MRDHEVPTHVQAEDRVLLGFTFPQIAAMMAMAGLAYGVWRFVPVPWSEVRLGLAVVFALVGLAAVVGRVGGRKLPLVAADLLKYNLGPRRFQGPVSDLVRMEPPPQPVAPPNPLQLLARKMRDRLSQRRKQHRERPPFRPHLWFGKRRRPEAADNGPSRKRVHKLIVPAAALAVLAVALFAIPPLVSADGPMGGEGWGLGEVEFETPEPVPGRRLFIEELHVTKDRAAVTVRAATEVNLRVRAFGGATGSQPLFFGFAGLAAGDTDSFDMPLHGPDPSLTFAWQDSKGYAGAVSLKDDQLPYPLPQVKGRLCDLTVTSLRWRPGAIDGVMESECATDLKEIVDLQTSRGHRELRVNAQLDASVTRNYGTVTVTVPETGDRTTTALVPGGETRFSVRFPDDEDIRSVTIDTDVAAALRIPQPQVVEQTYHPAWTERLWKRVRIWCGDHYRRRWVVFYKYHAAHVRSEMVSQPALSRTVREPLQMTSSINADAPYALLAFPEPEAPASEQTPLSEEDRQGLGDILDRLRWPW